MSVDTEHDKCVLWIYVLKCIYMCQSLTRSYNIVQYGCSFDWILQWHSIWSVELNEEISSEMRNNRYTALVFEFDDTFSHQFLSILQYFWIVEHYPIHGKEVPLHYSVEWTSVLYDTVRTSQRLTHVDTFQHMNPKDAFIMLSVNRHCESLRLLFR